MDLEGGLWRKAPSYIFQKTTNTSEANLDISNVLFFDEVHVHSDWFSSVGELSEKLQLGKDIALIKFKTADGVSNSRGLQNLECR